MHDRNMLLFSATNSIVTIVVFTVESTIYTQDSIYKELYSTDYFALEECAHTFAHNSPDKIALIYFKTYKCVCVCV